MKPYFLGLGIAFCSFFLVARTAPAQEDSGEAGATRNSIANPLAWVNDDGVEWSRGGLYALGGLIGALVTVFHLVGGVIPGTAGGARIDAGRKRVEEREKVVDGMISDNKVDPSRLQAVQQATNSLRDDLRSDRQRQFLLAAVLYLALGAAFAATLAGDVLQAVVIGSGWTAYLGAIGIKGDYAARKAIKDDTTEKLEKAISMAQDGSAGADYLADLLSEAQVSKAI